MSANRPWTPGPWGLSSLEFAMNDGAIPVIAPDDRVCLVDAHAKFRRGLGHMAKCEIRDANARLIAAAPDLAEALLAIYLWAKAFGDSGDGGFWDFNECPEGKAAIVALTKAGVTHPVLHAALKKAGAL